MEVWCGGRVCAASLHQRYAAESPSLLTLPTPFLWCFPSHSLWRSPFLWCSPPTLPSFAVVCVVLLSPLAPLWWCFPPTPLRCCVVLVLCYITTVACGVHLPLSGGSPPTPLRWCVCGTWAVLHRYCSPSWCSFPTPSGVPLPLLTPLRWCVWCAPVLHPHCSFVVFSIHSPAVLCGTRAVLHHYCSFVVFSSHSLWCCVVLSLCSITTHLPTPCWSTLCAA
jgi:hypothetical protein